MFNTGEKYYKCSIYDRTILSCDDFTFSGFHLPERTHQDVTYVEFGEPCSKIPPGLTKVFPNMKILGICNAGLKTISKEDLAEYKNLERFICESCKVEFLSRNLFEGFENLKHIKFIRNKLTIIEPNILDGLDKLEYVNFRSNPNYSKFYSANPIYVSDSTLEQIKNHLFEKFFTLDKKIIRNYVDNYPDKIEILRIFREKSNEVNTNLRMHELTYDFYDQNRLKDVTEHEKCEVS